MAHLEKAWHKFWSETLIWITVEREQNLNAKQTQIRNYSQSWHNLIVNNESTIGDRENKHLLNRHFTTVGENVGKN